MPATAGRVRMPANNRVHSSAALQTHGIWQSAIGYDPYAPENTKQQRGDGAGSASHAGTTSNEQNAYDSFQSLLALARHSGSATDEARGACKKCGRVGHLTFQCRNFLTVTKEDMVAAASVAAQAALSGKRKEDGHVEFSDSESSEEESDLSDSDQDSEMERLIAARMGKSLKRTGEKKNSLRDDKRDKNGSRSRKKKVSSDEKDSDSSDSDGNRRKRRHRSRRKHSRKTYFSDSDTDHDDNARKHRKVSAGSSDEDDLKFRKHRKDYEESGRDDQARNHAKKRKHRSHKQKAEEDSDSSVEHRSRKSSSGKSKAHNRKY